MPRVIAGRPIVCHRLLLLTLALAGCSGRVEGQTPATEEATVRVYFVRHGETDPSQPTVPLDSMGLRRATELVRVLERVEFTHVFASHTLRSRQAVEPTAASKGLRVVPLPPLGSNVDGTEITGVSPSRLAIDPLAEALGSLPDGSTALVGLNSDNLFGVLHGLGVPLGTSTHLCSLGQACVPCLDNTCFPVEFDNLWILTWARTEGVPELVWLKYGSP
jgi:hypothetical protein